MSERASYGKLGLFVVVSVALLLIGVTLLGAGAFRTRGTTFETYFAESVEGLEVGAPVKLKGVTIGKVTRMGFASDKYAIAATDRTREQQLMAGYIVVEMEIDPLKGLAQKDWVEKFKRTIDRGLRAQLTTAGLMGAAYVEISFVDPTHNPPMTIAWEPDRPYVPSMPSTMGQIKNMAERIARQLENAHLDEVVANVDKLIKDLDTKVGALDVKGMQGEVLSLATELRQTNTQIKQLLSNPAIDTTLSNVSATAVSLKSASAQVDTMLGNAQTKKMLTDAASVAAAASPAAADLRRLLHRLDVLISGQQDDLGATLKDLRRTAENTEQLTDDAKKNPSRLLFGDPPPKAKIPAESEHK